MKPHKDGTMYSEECWEAFTQTMKDKFMNKEISELTFFGDPENVKKKYTEKECNEAYKQIQKQRYYERGVRAWQRKQAIAEGLDDKKEIKMADYKLNYWRKRLNNYCEDNNLRRDYTREYIYR